MSSTINNLSKDSSFKSVLSAAKKLSAEEKQLLHLQLFSSNALNEMKQFELALKKNKKAIKKSDDDIVSLTTKYRRKQYGNTK
jgi:adenine-specific DNA methylase